MGQSHPLNFTNNIMRHFFKVLKTLTAEPRILRETWHKEVFFPENYWRTELCMFVLLIDDKDNLPNALKMNFCPLFWFSNFLLLTSPIWLCIFGFIAFCNYIGTNYVAPNLDSLEAWNSSRKVTYRLEKYRTARDVITSTKYDDKTCDFPRLEAGKRWMNTLLWYSGAVQEEESDPLNCRTINWEHPDLMKKCDSDQAYFLAFRRFYGDDWKSAYARIAENYAANIRKQQQEAEERTIRAKQVATDLNKLYASIFSWTKIFCKAVVFIVALPVLYVLALITYDIAVWLFYGIGWILWMLFIGHLSITLMVVALAVTMVIAFYVIAMIISAGYIGDFFNKFCDVVGPIAVAAIKPFVWLGCKVGAVCSFVYNFLRMFYVSNCPGIRYPDEKQVSSVET